MTEERKSKRRRPAGGGGGGGGRGLARERHARKSGVLAAEIFLGGGRLLKHVIYDSRLLTSYLVQATLRFKHRGNLKRITNSS